MRSLTLLIFAVGWALCGRPQPEHESVTPLLSLSPLNVVNIKPLPDVKKTSSESGLLFTFYLFTAFNNNVISNGTTLLLTPGLHRC